eukprot:355984-Chlamydomonas_euryale.AAC.7
MPCRLAWNGARAGVDVGGGYVATYATASAPGHGAECEVRTWHWQTRNTRGGRCTSSGAGGRVSAAGSLTSDGIECSNGRIRLSVSLSMASLVTACRGWQALGCLPVVLTVVLVFHGIHIPPAISEQGDYTQPGLFEAEAGSWHAHERGRAELLDDRRGTAAARGQRA